MHKSINVESVKITPNHISCWNVRRIMYRKYLRSRLIYTDTVRAINSRQAIRAIFVRLDCRERKRMSEWERQREKWMIIFVLLNGSKCVGNKASWFTFWKILEYLARWFDTICDIRLYCFKISIEKRRRWAADVSSQVMLKVRQFRRRVIQCICENRGKIVYIQLFISKKK